MEAHPFKSMRVSTSRILDHRVQPLTRVTRSDNLGGLHPRDQGCPRFFGRLEDLGKLKVAWEDNVRKHMPVSLRGSLSSCYIIESWGPSLRAVSEAKCIAVTWVCLEDYLWEQRSRADSLLSQTLKTERPSSNKRMHNCTYTVLLEGRSHLRRTRRDGYGGGLPHPGPTVDAIEFAAYRRGQLLEDESVESGPRGSPRGVPHVCQRKDKIIETTHLKFSTPGGSEELTQVLTQSPEGAAWEGPCVAPLRRESHAGVM